MAEYHIAAGNRLTQYGCVDQGGFLPRLRSVRETDIFVGPVLRRIARRKTDAVFEQNKMSRDLLCGIQVF